MWTPERHFHEVAGLYPNPSVLSAALAVQTSRVQLRAGSVVLPLHNPLRVAEEWAVVDNLSGDRAGMAVTSGWVPNDFALLPEHFAAKREVMFEGIETVRTLWRGGAVRVKDGVGKEVELRVFPRPVQPELPVWLTCTGDPAMFERAGALGLNVLTALLGQTLEQAAEKIALYRRARAAHGHDPAAGRVAMMLHTFVGPTEEAVLQAVRGPFMEYMRAHTGLFATVIDSLDLGVTMEDERQMDQLLEFAFERYYRTSSLLGTPEKCMATLRTLEEMGVDEVACLIDFGVPTGRTLAALEDLHALMLRARRPATAAAPADPAEEGARLQAFLRARLPAYMVPDRMVLLPELPRLPSGKVDRRALPDPLDALPAAAGFAEPEAGTEADLAAIWREVLGVRRVGRHDSFFALGGNSLAAVRLLSRVRNRLGADLSVPDLFGAPTLSAMADGRGSAAAGRPERRRAGRTAGRPGGQPRMTRPPQRHPFPPLQRERDVENRVETPEVPALRLWSAPPGAPAGTQAGSGLAEQVRRLFSAGADAAARDAALEARVDEIVGAYLRDESTTSVGGVEGMSEGFMDTGLADGPRDPHAYLDYLDEAVVPHTIRVASPKFIGHMTSALPFFLRPLTRLMTALNQNVVKTETSKVLTFYERQALARLHRVIYGLPQSFYDQHVQDHAGTLGIITSGGTIANVTALACARNRRLGPDGAFRGVDAVGIPAALAHHGLRGAVVIGSAQMHYSFEKGMGLMGLGTDDLLRVPTHGDGRVNLALMRAAAERCRAEGRAVLALVGVAGSTDSGCVDDLNAVADLAEEFGAHFHVDAAWGGPTAFPAGTAGCWRASSGPTRSRSTGTSSCTCPWGSAWCSCATPPWRGRSRSTRRTRRAPARWTWGSAPWRARARPCRCCCTPPWSSSATTATAG